MARRDQPVKFHFLMKRASAPPVSGLSVICIHVNVAARPITQLRITPRITAEYSSESPPVASMAASNQPYHLAPHTTVGHPQPLPGIKHTERKSTPSQGPPAEEHDTRRAQLRGQPPNVLASNSRLRREQRRAQLRSSALSQDRTYDKVRFSKF